MASLDGSATRAGTQPMDAAVTDAVRVYLSQRCGGARLLLLLASDEHVPPSGAGADADANAAAASGSNSRAGAGAAAAAGPRGSPPAGYLAVALESPTSCLRRLAAYEVHRAAHGEALAAEEASRGGEAGQAMRSLQYFGHAASVPLLTSSFLATLPAAAPAKATVGLSLGEEVVEVAATEAVTEAATEAVEVAVVSARELGLHLVRGHPKWTARVMHLQDLHRQQHQATQQAEQQAGQKAGQMAGQQAGQPAREGAGRTGSYLNDGGSGDDPFAGGCAPLFVDEEAVHRLILSAPDTAPPTSEDEGGGQGGDQGGQGGAEGSEGAGGPPGEGTPSNAYQRFDDLAYYRAALSMALGQLKRASGAKGKVNREKKRDRRAQQAIAPKAGLKAGPKAAATVEDSGSGGGCSDYGSDCGSHCGEGKGGAVATVIVTAAATGDGGDAAPAAAVQVMSQAQAQAQAAAAAAVARGRLRLVDWRGLGAALEGVHRSLEAHRGPRSEAGGEAGTAGGGGGDGRSRDGASGREGGAESVDAMGAAGVEGGYDGSDPVERIARLLENLPNRLRSDGGVTGGGELSDGLSDAAWLDQWFSVLEGLGRRVTVAATATTATTATMATTATTATTATAATATTAGVTADGGESQCAKKSVGKKAARGAAAKEAARAAVAREAAAVAAKEAHVAAWHRRLALAVAREEVAAMASAEKAEVKMEDEDEDEDEEVAREKKAAARAVTAALDDETVTTGQPAGPAAAARCDASSVVPRAAARCDASSVAPRAAPALVGLLEAHAARLPPNFAPAAAVACVQSVHRREGVALTSARTRSTLVPTRSHAAASASRSPQRQPSKKA